MNNRVHRVLWRWICPWAMVGLAVVVIYVFGLSIWTALIVALLLACPAVILWGAVQVKRQKKH